MGVLNEERLALYDGLIKKYCLNHNDLLTKIYEISYFKGEWCCDDDSFFNNRERKVVIAYFDSEISSDGSGELHIWHKNDYCDMEDRWPIESDNFYEDKRQLYIYYNNYLPQGYTFLFATGTFGDYWALSHPSQPEIYIPEDDDTDFTPPPVYTATQGWDSWGDGYGFAAVNDPDLFYSGPVNAFILQCDNPIEVAYGYVGMPDENCSYGFDAEHSRYFKGTINGTIPQGYNLFVKSADGYYVLISSHGINNGGGGSGADLPSGSEGQFMVYTNGKWQGRTIAVGGSY